METEEKVFFEQGNIKVTNSRFIVPAQTYAMSGVTSVRTVYSQPLKGPAILGIFGAVCVGAIKDGEYGAAFVGLICVAIAVVWFIKRKRYTVVLSSASGETEALTSKDSSLVSRIVAALNDAIISRG